MTDQQVPPTPEEENLNAEAEQIVEAQDAEQEPSVNLEEQLAALTDELAKTQKALSEADLRARAEVQNMRRRMEMDVEKAHKFALKKFAGDILSVADSLERGLSALDANDAALKPAREGLELTLKQLLDVFARFQIEQIDPIGEPFNPELHEAMTMVPNPSAEPNSVMDVLEKGYTLNGLLLRPARVVVVK